MAWPWNNSNSPAEYCRPQKKGFPKGPLIFLHPTEEAPQSANLTEIDFHKSVGLRLSFYTKGLKCTAQPKNGMPIPTQKRDNLVSQLSEVSPMWIVLSHHWHHKNREERSSQMRLMITTNWRFSWKQNTVKYYLQDTVTNLRVKCQGLVITT